MFFVQDKSFYRSLLALALPLCAQNFLMYGVTLADSLMVGRLGETAIGGLYVGVVYTVVLSNFMFGITSTIVILTAQYWGMRRLEPIRDIGSMAARILCVLGLIATLLALFCPRAITGFLTSDPEIIACGASYIRMVAPAFLLMTLNQGLLTMLRGVEVVRVGMINSALALCANLLLNWLLIYGHWGFPALGVPGAALATVLSRIVETGFVAWYALKYDRVLGFRLRDFLRWNPVLLRDLIRYGTPLMLGQCVWAMNQLTRGVVIGHMDARSVAIAGVADAIDGLVWMGPLGFAMAASLLVGKAIGRNAFDLVKAQARTLQVLFLGFGLVTGLLLLLGRDVILGCYNLQPETLAMAPAFYWVLTVCSVGRCYQAPSLMGLVKAGGDTSFVFKNDSFWFFCWILPGALLAQRIFHAPDWMVYAVLLSDQVTKCFVAFVKINRFRWMKNLTRPDVSPRPAP